MTLKILRLGQHGDGVARDELGATVHVPRTLPGEIVEGDRAGDRIPSPRVVTPVPERVAPPCRHFRRCGACALQHASDGFVADWKAGRVIEALGRAGIAARIAGVATSPPGTRRRAALAGRKTKKGAQVGFHVAGGHEIVEIPDCKVLAPGIVAALPALERVTRLAAPRGAEVTLHVTQGPEGLDLSIGGAGAMDRDVMEALAPLGRDFVRIAWNGEVALQQVPPAQPMGRARVVPPPGAFLQATRHGEAALVGVVGATLTEATRIVDLFAGCGTFTFPAAETAPVHAVEGDGDLLAALAEGARHATGLKPITTARRDLFRDPLDEGELSDFDAAIIDPPRAGAAAQVAMLARSDLRTIAFVSCNPATFARDAATLVSAGWRMGAVRVVDQFRWSPHIELVTRFDRESPAR
ncbi:class I SAM-dependent RNA methyltransferase [Jannaschia sp. S6380]|uniref:class I SAM-dependent RNA methyltransferase n=1 Tax=Jannaschia sp. S6380 TaxID=2926408 RepID=UPI001FF20B7A|nr:class I SAM-dependent RNA methyltransferase [Jannaschia sp. S6380]MCK0168768.1 class I SAM-dependent RNA methyltransferase [Jannaschia sp. S6380]